MTFRLQCAILLMAAGVVSPGLTTAIADEPGPTAIAWWRMGKEPGPDHARGSDFSPQPAVRDQADAKGQGSQRGGVNCIPSLDALWFFQRGGDYPQADQAAPQAMYAQRVEQDKSSFAAYRLADKPGILEFPADQYGVEFEFSGNKKGDSAMAGLGFTWEFVFCSTNKQGKPGSQAGDHVMQLIETGQGGLLVNEGGKGNLRFALVVVDANDGNLAIERLDISTKDEPVDVLDGQWHYIRAVYDDKNDEMTLTVLREDGREFSRTHATPFGTTVRAGVSNIKIGATDLDHKIGRHFVGLIDEVRISAGVVVEEQGLCAPREQR